ncbi:MAG: tetratricopeptide repeat protein [Brumimicrobium sp.]|nr:tetratricopeptide repeat protein [Brumimicrobium sp.]
MKYFLTISIILCCYTLSLGQSTDEQLANYYFNQGDCEKAIPYFQKIYPKNPSPTNYSRYLSCLRETQNDKEIIKLISKQIDIYPNNYEYPIQLGKEYERMGDVSKAEKIYKGLISNLPTNASLIITLQREFTKANKNQLALEALEKGRSLLKGNYPLNVQFAEVYGALGQTDKMIKEYITLLDYNPSMLSSLKIILPQMIDFQDANNERFKIFEQEVLLKIQKNPSDEVYANLLIWSFVQQKNFSAALVQAKALDKRTSNDGREVYALANQALQNNDFSTARKAYRYILDLGESKPYYYTAEQLLLNTRFKEITIVRNYSQEDIDQTINEYKAVLNRIPKNGKALPIVQELAYIEAYYGNQANEAIRLLNEALTYPKYNDLEEAKLKILLADILLLNNEIWDASLLYMQVEKAFKYEPIGEEAKFKNARIFYYDGDFKFAQSQLDILKEATTKLIANDAMNLSIFITENLGLDSNYVAMRQFAKADLLVEQHQYDAAFLIYDSISRNFPNHQLMDNILYKKAEAFQYQGKWEVAIEYLQKIVDEFPEDILADDALYQIALIYENHLFNNKKASDYYFQLMKDYPGSLFVTEARKAYRNIN